MTILGTLLATTLLAFIWFIFGSRQTRMKDSIDKKKDEMEDMKNENPLISNTQISTSKTNFLHTASAQSSGINSPMVENSSDIQEQQKNSLIDEWSSAVSIKDDDDDDDDNSSNIISLSSLETGITVTDMTAEVPTALSPISVIELNDLMEAMTSIDDKIEPVENNNLILQSETATNASFKTNIKTKYSITKLRSNDITSFSHTDTHNHNDTNMKSNSTSDYISVNKYLSNNCCNLNSEIIITKES
ncbi:hypothetical protein DINM_001119 [Dirofilaria immitis]|nr:hypothetical protein [Dirofilaria immitis]